MKESFGAAFSKGREINKGIDAATLALSPWLGIGAVGFVAFGMFADKAILEPIDHKLNGAPEA